MGQLGLEGMFTGEDDRIFVFSRGFELGDFFSVFGLSFLDGFQADL